MATSPVSCFRPSPHSCSKLLCGGSWTLPVRSVAAQLRNAVPTLSTAMVSDGYSNSSFRVNTKTAANKSRKNIFSIVDSCLVIPPSLGRKPRAIIKFLGGAFIGAVPEFTYGYLIEQLAREGYLVVSVPYNVTFDHASAANQVYERFNSCLESLLENGLPDSKLAAADLRALPLFSVGHSNGALLQGLVGSYFAQRIPKANVIISFNNRPATEAVPYFEQVNALVSSIRFVGSSLVYSDNSNPLPKFGPLVNQMMPVVEASPVSSLAMTASGDAWNTLLDLAGAVVPESNQEALAALRKFVDQLPSVMNQVTEGISEFKPTPAENRDCFKNLYNVQHTLLVKFTSDTIDETDLLEEALKPRVESMGGTIEKVQLSGNHLTPCIQEPNWDVGSVYTPADAIAQGLKSYSLSDTRGLSTTISNWLARFED